MRTYQIAVIPGDGTGPEVVQEGIKVLDAACTKHDVKLQYEYYDFGGERYLKTGELLPDSAIDELRKFDAIFLGAIGHPDVKPGILEKEILLNLRFSLDLYINLRPVKLYPGVDTPLKRYRRNSSQRDAGRGRHTGNDVYPQAGRALYSICL